MSQAMARIVKGNVLRKIEGGTTRYSACVCLALLSHPRRDTAKLAFGAIGLLWSFAFGGNSY